MWTWFLQQKAPKGGVLPNINIVFELFSLSMKNVTELKKSFVSTAEEVNFSLIATNELLTTFLVYIYCLLASIQVMNLKLTHLVYEQQVIF